MATIFETACAAASAAVDIVYGDDWLYMPMATDDPNGRRAPDPSRARIAITATFFDPYARAFSGPARRQGLRAEKPGHASSRPVLDLALGQLCFAPRAGDRVRCENASTSGVRCGAVFEVAEVRPDGTGRAELDLNWVER